MTSLHTVETDDEMWALRFEADFDGVYPVEWLHNGLRYTQEPPWPVYDELTKKAYGMFHEKDTE